MTVPVLVAVTGPWEASLVSTMGTAASDVRVVRRCADLAELIAAAGAGLGRVALVSADLDRLDRDAVATLLATGTAVVGLTDPGHPGSGLRLARLGVPRLVAADAPAADVEAALVAAVEERVGLAAEHDAPPPERRGLVEGVGRTAEAVGRTKGAPLAPRGGRLLAVWGPVGAPGRTTVAVTVASELAASGVATLLVDADTYAAGVAQTLGLLDETAGLAAAARAAGQGVLDVARLVALAPLVVHRLRVLTGLPRPSRWPELRPSALEVVWQRAREIAAWTVVDCGFALDPDDDAGPDHVPRRSQASLSALRAADAVLAVGAADPVGLQRLVRGMQDLRPVLRSRGGGAAPDPRVVVTKVRAAAVGPDPNRRIKQALARYAGVSDPVLVPDDRPALDEAMLLGRSLTECAPRSAARLALAELATGLAGAGARAPASGAHRRGS